MSCIMELCVTLLWSQRWYSGNTISPMLNIFIKGEQSSSYVRLHLFYTRQKTKESAVLSVLGEQSSSVSIQTQNIWESSPPLYHFIQTQNIWESSPPLYRSIQTQNIWESSPPLYHSIQTQNIWKSSPLQKSLNQNKK